MAGHRHKKRHSHGKKRSSAKRRSSSRKATRFSSLAKARAHARKYRAKGYTVRITRHAGSRGAKHHYKVHVHAYTRRRPKKR